MTYLAPVPSRGPTAGRGQAGSDTSMLPYPIPRSSGTPIHMPAVREKVSLLVRCPHFEMHARVVLGVGKGVLFREVSSVQECPHNQLYTQHSSHTLKIVTLSHQLHDIVQPGQVHDSSDVFLPMTDIEGSQSTQARPEILKHRYLPSSEC